MKFQHLIQINDLFNPHIDQLSREQLWNGLVMRARLPKLFVPHLDACDLLESSADSLTRELRYGELVIRDKVLFYPQSRVHYHVHEQENIPASSLIMSIEEPEQEALFIRFTYDDGTNNEENAEAFYNEFRKSAYEASDIDTVRIIRELAEQGRLDRQLN